MAGDKFLVLGGTGEAGINLLRELLHRNHATVVYARNPSKIPADLASNTSLEVEAFSAAELFDGKANGRDLRSSKAK